MPQLMPLLWISSIFMSLLLMLMLVELFYYKEEFIKISNNIYNNLNKLMYKW